MSHQLTFADSEFSTKRRQTQGKIMNMPVFKGFVA